MSASLVGSEMCIRDSPTAATASVWLALSRLMRAPRPLAGLLIARLRGGPNLMSRPGFGNAA
eukprot:12848169-Alexandrium_andersonii.AAC.1